MKRIMRRSYLVLFVALAFFGGICFLAFRVVTENAKWVQHPFNGHVEATDGLSGAGDITDRKGEKLAYNSEDNHRKYHDDAEVRKALLHVVGDKSMNISTSIQSMFRADLTGYNFVLGMGLPKSLKSSRDVQLTVDAQACKAAYEALGDRKGACVVYNYKTGEILCSVSNSTYDPEDPPDEDTVNNDEWYNGVYLDNVLSSTYTPGSTFKIITAAAAIENIPDIYERTFDCEGSIEIGGNPINCTDAHSQYGKITFEEAFAHSCNVVFAQLAIEIGPEKMKETAEKMGFNSDKVHMSGIPIAESYYNADGADDNSLAWTGIGQGFGEYEDKANPLRMAMTAGAVANGGTAVSPYIVEDDGSLMNKLGIATNKDGDTDMLKASTATQLQKLMKAAATYYDSSKGIKVGDLPFCAKTGTAERGDGKDETAWFVGYTEDANHPYAFAVVVEEGGSGADAAAPVADAAVSALVN